MDEMVEHMRSKEAPKKVTFSLPDDSETEDVTEVQLEKDISPSEIKSSFEKRQEKVILVWFSLGFVHIYLANTSKRWQIIFFYWLFHLLRVQQIQRGYLKFKENVV